MVGTEYISRSSFDRYNFGNQDGWMDTVCIGNFSYVHCTVSSGVLNFFNRYRRLATYVCIVLRRYIYSRYSSHENDERHEKNAHDFSQLYVYITFIP